MTEAEIDYFYNVFITLDEDASGEMDTEEFYGHFNLDRSPYAKRLFEFMGALERRDLR